MITTKPVVVYVIELIAVNYQQYITLCYIVP